MILAFGAHAFYYNYATDDAFITFRYVRNMLAGKGLVYNPGERVEGYTNFLWAMIVAAPAALGADIVRASKALGLLSGAGTLILVTAIARLYAGRRLYGRAGELAIFLPAALLAANGSFAMWSLGGLETAFFTFLVTLASLVYLKAESRLGMYACGALYALIVMTRPDGIVLLAAVVIHMTVASSRFRMADSPGRPGSDILRLLAAFLVIYLPYFIWRYSYYGYPLPNTFYAKVAYGIPVYLRGVKYVWRFVADYAFVPISAAAVFFYARMQRPASSIRPGFLSSFLLLQTAAYTAFIIYVGGDQLVMQRFFVPVLPFIYLLSFRGFAELFMLEGAIARRPAWHAGTAAILAGAIALTCLPSFLGKEHHRVFDVERPADADRRIVGEWLRKNLGDETTIALIPAGIIPFYSGLKTIDLVGLNDKRIAHAEVADLGRGEPGHEKYDSAYVLERRPDLIFLGACRIWPEKLTAERLVNYYWIYGMLAPGNREMLDLAEFKRNYSPYAARVDSGYIHFFKRNDFYMTNAESIAPYAGARRYGPLRKHLEYAES